MIRLIVASVFSPFIMITGVMMIRSYLITNSVVFRTVGANKLAQERVKTLYQYLALIKADVQIALTMALLILRDGSNLNLEDKILLPVVLVYSISSCVVGFLMVRYENARMVILYTVMWLLMPTYSIFLIIESAIYMQNKHRSSQEKGLTAVIFVSTIVSLIVRVCILYYVLRVFLNFGAGLRQRVFENYIDDENRHKGDDEDDTHGVENPTATDDAGMIANAQHSVNP